MPQLQARCPRVESPRFMNECSKRLSSSSSLSCKAECGGKQTFGKPPKTTPANKLRAAKFLAGQDFGPSSEPGASVFGVFSYAPIHHTKRNDPTGGLSAAGCFLVGERLYQESGELFCSPFAGQVLVRSFPFYRLHFWWWFFGLFLPWQGEKKLFDLP